MERLLKIIACSLSLLLLYNSHCAAAGGRKHLVYIEAESFQATGGWVVDQQFTQTMGSPYLLAHGLGRPVADAETTLQLPHEGEWHVYVRTYNWTAPWSGKEGPGAFSVLVEGRPLEKRCGTTGTSWMWQSAGSFPVSDSGKPVRLGLRDHSGFDGRCDAVLLSDRVLDPEDLPDGEALVRFRNRLVKDFNKIAVKERYDLVVVGAGIAGICTAVSAARLGLRVALVHDRPVLGGNNSTEIRVRLGGGIARDPYPNLGNLLKEFAHDKTPSAEEPENYQEWKKEKILADEPGITLMRSCQAVKVDKRGSRIRRVYVRDIRSGQLMRLTAPLFADCTGDGNLGVMAGADHTYGREASSQYGEVTAPPCADSLVLGASVQWRTRLCSNTCDFPEFQYGLTFNETNVYRDTAGKWSWEAGFDKDMVLEAEQIRDFELIAIYSNWSYLKNHSSSSEEFEKRDLDWVAFILGKRESRRLLGDVVLTEQDIDQNREFEDAAVTMTWPIDLHYAKKSNADEFGGLAFRATSKHKKIDPYPIPYRCFYSRNVDNLFMAGRDISVSHVVLGASRVMRTGAMMVEVVGMAASVCHKHKVLPRAVYTDYLDELKDLMIVGVGEPGLPNTQNFHER